MREYLFDEGFSFVLFDCERPSYLQPAIGSNERTNQAERVEIASGELRLAFKKLGRCGQDGVWRRRKLIAGAESKKSSSSYQELNYLTYDVRNQGVGYSPSNELLRIMRLKGMCDDYMKFMYHPGYFVSGFRRPPECEGNDRSDANEEAKLERIMQAHNRMPHYKSRR